MERICKWTKKTGRALRASEKGISIVEVLIAMVILGVIAVPFLMGMSTAFKGNIVANSQSKALSLAQSWLDIVRNKSKTPYKFAVPPSPGEVTYYTTGEIILDPIYNGYEIWSEDSSGTEVPGIIGVPWDNTLDSPSLTDVGLQKVKLVIKDAGDKTILTLETFKVKR